MLVREAALVYVDYALLPLLCPVAVFVLGRWVPRGWLLAVPGATGAASCCADQWFQIFGLSVALTNIIVVGVVIVGAFSFGFWLFRQPWACWPLFLFCLLAALVLGSTAIAYRPGSCLHYINAPMFNNGAAALTAVFILRPALRVRRREPRFQRERIYKADGGGILEIVEDFAQQHEYGQPIIRVARPGLELWRRVLRPLPDCRQRPKLTIVAYSHWQNHTHLEITANRRPEESATTTRELLAFIDRTLHAAR